MRDVFSLKSPSFPEVTLRTAGPQDQENLRNWKNSNRQRFFFQGIISPQAQEDWFARYVARERDYMFMVEAEKREIGCMAIRWEDGAWDIYNVILGRPDGGRKGHMRGALQMMCSFALGVSRATVAAKVLKDNPALEWYCRNGFMVTGSGSDHAVIELGPAFSPCPLTREE